MRIAIADDSAFFASGLRSLLEVAGADVVAVLPDTSEVVGCVLRAAPDVVILDLCMPPGYSDEGLLAAEALRAHGYAGGLLVLSAHLEPGDVARLLRIDTGGLGMLSKDRVTDISTLMESLRRLDEGGTLVDPEVVTRLIRRKPETSSLQTLSLRARQVLALIAEGRSNSAIADALNLSERTVEKHAAAVFDRLGLEQDDRTHRRVQAALIWLRQGGRGRSPGEGDPADDESAGAFEALDVQ